VELFWSYTSTVFGITILLIYYVNCSVLDQSLHGKHYNYNIKKINHTVMFILLFFYGLLRLCATVVVARGSHSLARSKTVLRAPTNIYHTRVLRIIIIIIAIIMILLLSLSLLFRLSRTTLILWLIC